MNRVHYGLLRPHEIARMSALNTLPRSRRYLAVPFVGKDAPSAASEYAHPDIGIGLTYLAYRYEGLRRTDFGGCLQHMRATLQAELPYISPVSRLYLAYISQARFLSMLTDDRAQASMSYVEFLCHIHRQIQSKFN